VWTVARAQRDDVPWRAYVDRWLDEQRGAISQSVDHWLDVVANRSSPSASCVQGLSVHE